MKNQALFSLKDKCKKLSCHLLQFLFGALGLKSCCSQVPRLKSIQSMNSGCPVILCDIFMTFQGQL